MNDRAKRIARAAAVLSATLMTVGGLKFALEPLLGEFSQLSVLLIVPAWVVYWRALDPLLTTEAELRLALELAKSGMQMRRELIEFAVERQKARPNADGHHASYRSGLKG